MPFLAGDDLTAAKMEKIANVPRIRALASVAQTIPNNAFTAVNFGVEVYKTGITHSTSSNTHQFTVTVAGLYILTGGIYFDTNGTGSRALKFQKNGVDIQGSGANTGSWATVQTSVVARPTEVDTAVGDVITMLCYQAAGGSLGTFVTVDYAWPSFSMRLIRDNSL